MKSAFTLSNIKGLFAGLFVLSTLASCSSYQYTGYDSDGIYGSQEQPPQQQPRYTQENYTETSDDALYYKRLFAQQSAQMEAVAESGMIFTDVDSYSSAGNYDEETYVEGGFNYTGGNPGWGDQPDEIAINIYNDPFMSPFYGPGFAGFYGFNRFYGNPWRYGYGRFGFGPWGGGFGGFGYGNPYGVGFVSHWGFDPYWMNPWNGWGYGPYYNPYWGSRWVHHPPYYGADRRNVAYNAGRRNAYNYDAVNTRSNLSSTRATRISDYSNSRNVRAERSSSTLRSNRTDSRTYSTRATRVESPESRSRSSAAYRSSRSSDAGSYNTRARAVRETRSNSYPNTVRSSSNTSRSTGTMRSSSPVRSSGTSSGSSSRGSRGRGN